MWGVWIEIRPMVSYMQRTWFFHTLNHAPRKNVLTDSVERDILILLEVIEGALRA